MSLISSAMRPRLEFTAWDRADEYYMVGNVILGVIEIICGLFSISLGIGAICVRASGYYIAYGIWCGAFFLVSGCIGIGAGVHKSVCMIMTNMLISMLAFVCGSVQLSLGVVAAYSDSSNNGRDSNTGIYSFSVPSYDIYYSKNGPLSSLCAGKYQGLGWAYAWGPVDVLLLLFGFIELLIALITAILCCKSVCCGFRHVSLVDQRGHTGHIVVGGGGVFNDGYSTTGRSTKPLVA